MRAAPRPANISTKDDADCEKNCALDSCATALASSVLPVPGGPWRRMPFGTCAPSALELRCGSRRNSTTSRSSSLASSTPAMSSQPIVLVGVRLDLHRLRPGHHLQRPPQHVDDRGHEDEADDPAPVGRELLDVLGDGGERRRGGGHPLVIGGSRRSLQSPEGGPGRPGRRAPNPPGAARRRAARPAGRRSPGRARCPTRSSPSPRANGSSSALALGGVDARPVVVDAHEELVVRRARARPGRGRRRGRGARRCRGGCRRAAGGRRPSHGRWRRAISSSSS